MYEQHITNKIAEFISLHLITLTNRSCYEAKSKIHISHLNACQRLVGPNGVSSNHIDPVIMDGNSTLILTWGRQSRHNV